MQDVWKVVWSIPFISVAFFPSLKQNFIAYHSSKVSSRPDWIFEFHQLWQSGFSRVYSNCCCSCLFEPEIMKIGHSSHKILNFQESTTILNACTKMSGNLLKAPLYMISLRSTCCGAYKYVDSANEFMWMRTAKAIWRNKGEVMMITNDNLFCRIYKRECKCPWRLYVFAVGRLTRVAGVGRVVEFS